MTNAILTWVLEGLVLSSGNLAGSEPVNLLRVCPLHVDPQTHLLQGLCFPAESTCLVSTGDLWPNVQCRRIFKNNSDLTANYQCVDISSFYVKNGCCSVFHVKSQWVLTWFLHCAAIFLVKVPVLKLNQFYLLEKKTTTKYYHLLTYNRFQCFDKKKSMSHII